MAYFVRQNHRAPKVTTPPTADESLPKVCIIGAGSSGIAAAKAMSEKRVPFDWFEMGQHFGGNWVLNNSNGVSACYETLEINTSNPRMAFSDFPMPAHYPPYARHDQVAEYFEAYVEHFAVRDRVTFNTKVESVTRAEENRWRVEFSGPKGRETREYDAVIVANGHHWDPRWPEPSYPGDFDGEQIHAHDYRSGDQLAGRDVVVVGAGNSAMDIAVEASYRANSVAWSVRRTEWVLRKFLFGKATDQVSLPGWLPWWATSARLWLGAKLSGSMTKYGLPKPKHAPGQSHPVQSEQIRKRLEAGAITVRPGISHLAGDRVVFTDGSESKADLIVWATGYRVSFPFLPTELVDPQANELPLWWRTVHPELPGLFFVGLLQPVGAVMPLAEKQSVWIAEMLAGDYVAPAPSQIRKQMLRAHEANKRQFYDSPRHTMEVDFDHFLWSLDRERKRGRARAEKQRKVDGKVIAVTGGARGIGFEIASQLAREGALVAIGDVREEAAVEAAGKLPGAIGLHLDVSDSASFAAFFDEVEQRLGPVDVLVNNAGVMWVGAFADEPEAALARQLHVNLMGVIHGVKLASKRMRERGRGHIITVASAASFVSPPGEATYAATKHGVLGYLTSVREELRGTGVQVSMVAPVVVNTELAAGTAPGGAPLLAPEEVGAAVVDLVRRPRWQVSLPGYVAPLAKTVNVLPLRLRDAIARRMVPNQVKKTDHSARSSYENSMALNA
ncbi:SDR family NAD(P)-dependent oxidoreductase [Corynebacterium mayonis]|uniref:SDR family NAD(P)-dependent oxidoreductase n=1 Tax=Corynebacterium mayonis TaxID=3062461 RepID=UPI0031409140